MPPADEEFQEIAIAIVRRLFRQQAQPPPEDARLAEVAARLADLVRGRRGPRPAGEAAAGKGGLGESEIAALTAEVAGERGGPVLGEAAKQLVKACFYPPNRACRDTFREVGRDGVCRRQQLERARGRISGSHCVDCPHWTGLTPERHAEYFAAEWRMVPAVLATHREVFLPPDFRALRQWLAAAERDGFSGD